MHDSSAARRIAARRELTRGNIRAYACLFCLGMIGGNSLLLSGCAELQAFVTHSSFQPADFASAETRREEYRASRSPEALRWLVTHLLTNGMNKGDVDSALGEEGERVFDDREILAEGGLYRSDDTVYRWGPDSDGNVYMFVFRDNHLVNFENFSDELKSEPTTRFGFSLSSDDL